MNQSQKHFLSLPILLQELQIISPMPTDEELEQNPQVGMEKLQRYQEIIDNIAHAEIEQFNEETVRILASSFGLGDGFGMYWATVHVLEKMQKKSFFYPIIQQQTKSPNPGTRKWCCLLLGRRRNKEDLPFILDLLKGEFSEVRVSALLWGLDYMAEALSLPQAIPSVEALLYDPKEDVKKYARETLARLQSHT
jgi:hypothetical protein